MPRETHHVAPELRPIYRRLSNAEHSLQEWTDTGYSPTKSELTNIQHAISYADEHYEQGAFKVDGKVPEGQAILANKLSHAHVLLRQFEINA